MPSSWTGKGVKSANTVTMMAAWLERQQQSDGSWPRPRGGYTQNHYDTSWAALALMATGDRQFDLNIRKAAVQLMEWRKKNAAE